MYFCSPRINNLPLVSTDQSDSPSTWGFPSTNSPSSISLSNTMNVCSAKSHQLVINRTRTVWLSRNQPPKIHQSKHSSTNQEKKRLLSGSRVHDFCIWYSSSRERGSEPVALRRAGSCIHWWYFGTWAAVYGTSMTFSPTTIASTPISRFFADALCNLRRRGFPICREWDSFKSSTRSYTFPANFREENWRRKTNYCTNVWVIWLDVDFCYMFSRYYLV